MDTFLETDIIDGLRKFLFKILVGEKKLAWQLFTRTDHNEPRPKIDNGDSHGRPCFSKFKLFVTLRERHEANEPDPRQTGCLEVFRSCPS